MLLCSNVGSIFCVAVQYELCLAESFGALQHELCLAVSAITVQYGLFLVVSFITVQCGLYIELCLAESFVTVQCGLFRVLSFTMVVSFTAVSGGVVYYCPMWAIAGSILCGTVYFVTGQ